MNKCSVCGAIIEECNNIIWSNSMNTQCIIDIQMQDCMNKWKYLYLCDDCKQEIIDLIADKISSY